MAYDLTQVLAQVRAWVWMVLAWIWDMVWIDQVVVWVLSSIVLVEVCGLI